jgi:hypothetical protein
MNKLEKLEHILNVFSKRLLPAFFFNHNPELFLKWQGNICKQSALLSVFIIKHYLGDEYTVQAWEGFFENDKLGSYNHCWNYLVHKDDPKLNIICDFTSTISYMDYCEHNDPTLHLGGSTSAVVKHKIDMVGMQEINIEEELSQPEYFTSERSDALIEELRTWLRVAKLWEDNPDE